jgi:hypothetical protein
MGNDGKLSEQRTSRRHPLQIAFPVASSISRRVSVVNNSFDWAMISKIIRRRSKRHAKIIKNKGMFPSARIPKSQPK